MPVFRLSPFEEMRSHRNWRASTYHGVCHASADDERMARLYVSTACGIAVERRLSEDTITSPWMNANLVECTRIAHIAGPEPPKGMVTFPLDAGRPDFMAAGPTPGEVPR